MLYHQNNVRFGFLTVNLTEKLYLYMILGGLVQKLIFQDGCRWPFLIWASSKKCWDFCEGHGGNFFLMVHRTQVSHQTLVVKESQK